MAGTATSNMVSLYIAPVDRHKLPTTPVLAHRTALAASPGPG